MVYLVKCTNCGGQYVGKSETSFKIRHSNHKREIITNKGGLGEHFFNTDCKFEHHYKVSLIDSVKVGDKIALKKREDHWIHQLRTLKVNGGNCMNLRRDT